MKKLNYLFLAMIVIASFTSSCKKGDIGPQGNAGAKGDKGDKGATGAAGDDGAKGATGTANVIYSDWVTGQNLADTVIDNSKLKIVHLAAPKLTQAILDKGTIMVYFNYGVGIFPLPYTSNAGGTINTINFLPRLGQIIITRFTNDNSGATSLPASLQYRYIIIPGGVHTAAAKQININDYDAVLKYYNIVK